jgi:hypothetical protein
VGAGFGLAFPVIEGGLLEPDVVGEPPVEEELLVDVLGELPPELVAVELPEPPASEVSAVLAAFETAVEAAVVGEVLEAPVALELLPNGLCAAPVRCE